MNIPHFSFSLIIFGILIGLGISIIWKYFKKPNQSKGPSEDEIAHLKRAIPNDFIITRDKKISMIKDWNYKQTRVQIGHQEQLLEICTWVPVEDLAVNVARIVEQPFRSQRSPEYEYISDIYFRNLSGGHNQIQEGQFVDIFSLRFPEAVKKRTGLIRQTIDALSRSR